MEQQEQTRREKIPDYFKDLNLDQIFEPILKSRKEFDLGSFFYTSLRDPNAIQYRQEIMKELEDDGLRGLFDDFSQSVYELGRCMKSVQESLSSADSYNNNYLARGRLLDYADRYCIEIKKLVNGLREKTLASEGLRNFVSYITEYTGTVAFTSLQARVKKLRDELGTVEYCMLIKSGTIHVRKYEGQADHSKEILRLFEKFRQGDLKDYRHKLTEVPHAQHVEAAVLRMLSTLYKDIFTDLDDFCVKYFHFVDPTIDQFSREIQFYLSWLNYVQPLRMKGLPFCYPTLCGTAEHLYSRDSFDLAFAHSLRFSGKPVTNDLRLDMPERIIVITGPNQGGKTTFARAFGQLHHLASLGLCVPGSEAKLYLFDNIFTHFGREEDLTTLNGKLQDDLVRLHNLFEKATTQSLIVINEIFASTTLSDAILLGKQMMDAIASLGAPTVCVTFIDELALHGEETVSMMSTVKEDDPAIRTYKIVRKPPDGLAYALHIVKKHGLTYNQLSERLHECNGKQMVE